MSFFKKKTLPPKKDTPSSVFFEKKDTGGLSKRHYLDEVLSFLKKKDTTSKKKTLPQQNPGNTSLGEGEAYSKLPFEFNLVPLIGHNVSVCHPSEARCATLGR